MKSFSLQDALAGKPVVNRAGERVYLTRLTVPSKSSLDLISQDSRGTILAYHHNDGRSQYGGGFDLFMASTQRTVFVNLWDSPSFHYTSHQSADEALAATGKTYTGRRFKKLNSEPIPIVVEVG